MISFFRNSLIVFGIFVAILAGINTYSLSVTHEEFLKSMKDNPQHAYFYVTPQAKKQVTIEDMSTFKKLASSLESVPYKKPPLGLLRKRSVKTELNPMDKQDRQKGTIVITYAFEEGRWVVADLNIAEQQEVATVEHD